MRTVRYYEINSSKNRCKCRICTKELIRQLSKSSEKEPSIGIFQRQAVHSHPLGRAKENGQAIRVRSNMAGDVTVMKQFLFGFG